jgi:hypothetical protein
VLTAAVETDDMVVSKSKMLGESLCGRVPRLRLIGEAML